MIEIADIYDSRINPYLSLRRQQGTFIVEGEKGITALLNSNLPVLSFFALSKYYEKLQLPAVPCYTADESIMTQIVGYRLHQGVMAHVAAPESVPLEDLHERIVVLNGLCNAENVGAIMRNCAAFGIRSVIVDEKSSDPYLRRSVKVSMGSVFNLKVHYTENLVETLNCLKEKGYTIVGADNKEGAINAASYVYPLKSVLIVGSEGHGLDVVESCQQLVKIPIEPQVDSLNVAAATAVLLYHMGSLSCS